MSGNLINVAIKSDEYCFLWIDWWATCLTKSEWAAWIQAIFSILAIFGSAYIANRQFIKGEVVKEESAARQLMQFYAHLKNYYEQLSEIEKTIYEGQFSIDSMLNFYNLVNEIFTLLKAIRIEDLSAEWAAVSIMGRANTVQLLFEIQRMNERYNNLMQTKHELFFKNPPEEVKQKFEKKFSEEMLKYFQRVIGFSVDFNQQVDILIANMNKKSRFFRPADLKEHFKMEPIKLG